MTFHKKLPGKKKKKTKKKKEAKPPKTGEPKIGEELARILGIGAGEPLVKGEQSPKQD